MVGLNDHATGIEIDKINNKLPWVLGALVLGPPLGFGVLLTIGPTMIVDSLFFWRKREALRRLLVASARATEIRVVNTRHQPSHIKYGNIDQDSFFITLGYQLENVSYVAKNEQRISKRIFDIVTTDSDNNRIVVVAFDQHTSLRWENNSFWGGVSSCYPASGPCYPGSSVMAADDSLCMNVCRFPFFLFVAAFVTGIVGTISGARTRFAYLVTAVVLLLIGVVLASVLYFHWRKTTLNAYQVVETVHAYQVVEADLPLVIDNNNKSHHHQSDEVERGMVDDDDTVVTEVCYNL